MRSVLSKKEAQIEAGLTFQLTAPVQILRYVSVFIKMEWLYLDTVCWVIEDQNARQNGRSCYQRSPCIGFLTVLVNVTFV